VNEEHALRQIADRQLVEPGSAPLVVFSGQHGGLRIVGETAIDGVLLSGGAYRRGALPAYQWLVELSERSAVRGTQSGASIASALESIVTGIERVYRPEAQLMESLRASAHVLLTRKDSLPSVFLHGDAAAWNALLTADGRVAFLDWEASEPNGLPMWDLFHFARSHVLAASRFRALTRRPGMLLRALSKDREFHAAIALYRDRLHIGAALVDPLFTLCWAHRALREVTRLESDRLDEGHYIGLMRESLRRGLTSR
jgi:hypothetical protein